MRFKLIGGAAALLFLLVLLGVLGWSRSQENCRYLRAVAEDASSAGAVFEAANVDPIVLELVDRPPIDGAVALRTEAAKVVLGRRPNFHISQGVAAWLERLGKAGSVAEGASVLREATAADLGGGFRCALPPTDAAGGSAPASGAFLERFRTPERFRAALVALDEEARGALAVAETKAAGVRAERAARERARLAALKAEMQGDANVVCRSRGAVAQAGAVYQQFLNTCNGPYGGQYYDCTQYNANVMASQVRSIADQRDRNEMDFATKWGSSSLQSITCY